MNEQPTRIYYGPPGDKYGISVTCETRERAYVEMYAQKIVNNQPMWFNNSADPGIQSNDRMDERALLNLAYHESCPEFVEKVEKRIEQLRKSKRLGQIENHPAMIELNRQLDEAAEKALDSLSRYKFQMFGYWAGVWVHLNKILATTGSKRPNPFGHLVNAARNTKR